MSVVAQILRRFRRRDEGATAVEFAILMPIMMVCFGAITEGSRIFWNYQSAVSGVRDAARYLARTTPATICNGLANASYVTLAGGEATARNIIERSVGTGSTNIFPLAVDVTTLTAAYACPDYELRTNPTPVARVQATLEIKLPFGTVFEIFGPRGTSVLTSTVTDQSRIYGI